MTCLVRAAKRNQAHGMRPAARIGITGKDARANWILATPARLAAGVTPAPGIYTEQNAATAFSQGVFWKVQKTLRRFLQWFRSIT
jgi:hypothetical protein